jgi:diadenosine tetraphosphate (Ap4A) HIT family hydrolase
MKLNEKKEEHNKRNCLFCHWNKALSDVKEEVENWKKELDKRMIDKGNDWFAVLDKSPKVLGHTLVISKYPLDDFTDNIDDLKNVEKHKKNLFEACMKVAKKLKSLFPPNKNGKIYIVSMCEHYEMWETGAGFTTEHLHFHLIPRHPDMSIKAEKLISREEKEWKIEDLERIAKLIKNSGITDEKQAQPL